LRIDENTNPLKLAWPIFIEVLLFMIMGNVDTVMLSRYSDLAVAAVGNANQILNTLLILFNITSAATGIMVTQFIGASHKKDLNQVYTLAFGSNILLSGLIAILLYTFQLQFFGLINMPAELYPDTTSYLSTMLGFLFVPALFTVSSVILKSHGQTKLSMYLAIGMNIVNVIGNYIFLFGPFGLPILGVKGVAISTVFSRSIAVVIMLFVLVKYYGVKPSLKHLFPVPKKLVVQFLKLGLPSAGEPISWQFSQMVIFSFINLMGTAAVTTKIYVQIIVWFTFLATLAIAQANQIIVGHLIGAGKEDEAYRITMRSVKQSLTVTMSVSLLFVVFRHSLMSIFTDDPLIIKLGAQIIMIDFLVEFGRVLNLVIINAFKAAGDVNFPVIAGVFSMWLVSTLGAYYFGVVLEFGLAGIWFAMAADEILRGLLMLRRLIKGGWRGKSVVHE
jgi:putative MATE family efflux protein